jgi:hypothetical protein
MGAVTFFRAMRTVCLWLILLSQFNFFLITLILAKSALHFFLFFSSLHLLSVALIFSLKIVQAAVFLLIAYFFSLAFFALNHLT